MASRTGGYLREGVGGVNLEKVLILGAVGFVAWQGYKLYNAARKAAEAAKAAATAAGESIGGNLADWFQKAPGDTRVYAVRLPAAGTVTGNVGINASAIGADGTFVYKGVRYRIRVDRSQVPDKVAVKL
jgi:hypothetical protein